MLAVSVVKSAFTCGLALLEISIATRIRKRCTNLLLSKLAFFLNKKLSIINVIGFGVNYYK